LLIRFGKATVEKAKTACRQMRLNPDDHFVDVTDMVEIGSGAKRERDNVHRLSQSQCFSRALTTSEI